MRNNIKKMLVIVPMIFVLSMYFIGINAKAADKVDKQDTITATSENITSTQNKESNKSSSKKDEDSKTNDNKTNTKDNKDMQTSSSENSTTISGQSIAIKNSSEVDVEQDKDSSTDVSEQTVVQETLPEWKNIDGKLHYVTEDGILEKTGWFKEEDENPDANNDYEYYLDKNHAATIGWNKIEGSWYYFNEAGIKQTGWKLINYNWYHLDKDGIMDIGWIKDDGNKFYLSDEGIMTVGKKYINDNWYFFGFNGILQTGFYNNNGKVYYSTRDGIMGVNQWINTKNNKYYVKSDSSIATGNIIIDNKMEGFNSSGRYKGTRKMKNYLFIKYLNVGNADCAFIKLPSGETALIDTGEARTSQEVVNFLKEQELKEEDGKGVIDYIIVTHGHSDHIGGLASILDKFKVKKVYMPDISIMKDWYSDVKVTTENSVNIKMMKIDYDIYNDAVKAMKDKNIKFTDTQNGDFIDKNEILQFVQSDKDFGPIGSPALVADYWGINENSALIYLNYGDLQAFFAADMEWNSEKDFWVNDLLSERDVDVLKVPHHGNDTSSTVDFIRYLKPDIGIISRSDESIVKNIAYNNLTSNGVSLYETSVKDGVSIYATPENWTVSQ